RMYRSVPVILILLLLILLAWVAPLAGLICSSVTALCALTVLIGGLQAYRRYRRSPERQWCDHVLQLVGAAGRRARDERTAMQRAGGGDEAADRAVRETAFRDYLAGISVSELEAYPGIGPATIAKLRDADFTHLAALDGASLELPGLGQKR